MQWCMFTCTYVQYICMYVHMYVYICLCMYVCICMCMCVRIHAWMHVFRCKIDICVYSCMDMHECTYMSMCINVYIHVHAYVCVRYICEYVCVYMYIHIFTCKHALHRKLYSLMDISFKLFQLIDYHASLATVYALIAGHPTFP